MSENKGKYVIIECPDCGRNTYSERTQLQIGLICPRCSKTIDNWDECVKFAGSLRDVQNRIKDISSPPEKPKEDSLASEMDHILEDEINYPKCPECNAPNCIENAKNNLLKCEECEVLYPKPIERADGANLETPNEKQQTLLESFGIKGLPSTAQDANDMILSITKALEKSIDENFPAYKHLYQDLKFKILFAVAKSPIFKDLYFKADKNNKLLISKDVLSEIILPVIDDEKLFSALGEKIDRESYRIVNEYVIVFSDFVFDKAIRGEDACATTLKLFSKGVGDSIVKFVKSKKQTSIKLIKGNDRIEILKKVSRPNIELDKMLLNLGFEKKSTGCLFIIIGFLVAGILLNI